MNELEKLMELNKRVTFLENQNTKLKAENETLKKALLKMRESAFNAAKLPKPWFLAPMFIIPIIDEALGIRSYDESLSKIKSEVDAAIKAENTVLRATQRRPRTKKVSTNGHDAENGATANLACFPGVVADGDKT